MGVKHPTAYHAGHSKAQEMPVTMIRRIINSQRCHCTSFHLPVFLASFNVLSWPSKVGVSEVPKPVSTCILRPRPQELCFSTSGVGPNPILKKALLPTQGILGWPALPGNKKSYTRLKYNLAAAILLFKCNFMVLSLIL